MKISLIATLTAFALIIYLGVMKYGYEQEVDPTILILAAVLAVVSSVLRRRGK